MGYRDAVRSCPECASPMEVVSIEVERESVEIDVCTRCQGTYLDFFDGDPGMIARGAASLKPAARLNATSPAGDLPEIQRCVCSAELQLHRYWEEGPELYRCGGCGGAFLTQAQFRALARYHVNEVKPSRFARVLAFLLGRSGK